jgi:hypothetical protein
MLSRSSKNLATIPEDTFIGVNWFEGEDQDGCYETAPQEDCFFWYPDAEARAVAMTKEPRDA